MNSGSSTTISDQLGAGTTFVDEGRLLRAVEQYLRTDDVEHVQQVLAYVRTLRDMSRTSPPPPHVCRPTARCLMLGRAHPRGTLTTRLASRRRLPTPFTSTPSAWLPCSSTRPSKPVWSAWTTYGRVWAIPSARPSLIPSRTSRAS